MSATITDESLLNNLRDLSVDLPVVSLFMQTDDLVVASARKGHVRQHVRLSEKREYPIAL